jgi:ABC-type phosphate transport system substrate-binding protein
MPLKTRIAVQLVSLALILGCHTVEADVVAVVSAKSPVTTLTKSEVADLFLGRSYRFPGGMPAVPIDQDEGTRAREEFYATFAGKSPAQVKSYWAKIIFTGRGQPPRTVSSDAEVRKILAANPQAIAYIERGAVDSSLRVLVEPQVRAGLIN